MSNSEQHQPSENLNEIAQVVVSISETHSELINTLKNEVETLSRLIDSTIFQIPTNFVILKIKKVFDHLILTNLSPSVRRGLEELLATYKVNSDKQIRHLIQGLWIYEPT